MPFLICTKLGLIVPGDKEKLFHFLDVQNILTSFSNLTRIISLAKKSHKSILYPVSQKTVEKGQLDQHPI